MARAFDAFNEQLLLYGDWELQVYRQKKNANLSTAIDNLNQVGIPLSPTELLAQIEKAEQRMLTKIYKEKRV